MLDIVNRYLEQQPQNGYLHYHAPRFSTLLRLIRQEYKDGDRILDIGRSTFTEILSEFLQTEIDTLGFPADSKTTTGRHYHFDLNLCQDSESWRREIEPYDLVVFAEVIEHLHTSPNLVFRFLSSIITRGGILILQTPNAVVLHKRLQMLLGKNPYEGIRENNKDPGHFREYTKKEITDYAFNTGFRVKKFFYGNYFDYRWALRPPQSFSYSPLLKIVNFIYALSPGNLKPGMTFVLVKNLESDLVLQPPTGSDG